LKQEGRKGPITTSTPPSTAISNSPQTRRPGAAGARFTKEEGNDVPKEEEPEPKEEDTSEIVDNAINAIGRSFARRRLRRQDTLRQKQEENAKLEGLDNCNYIAD